MKKIIPYLFIPISLIVVVSHFVTIKNKGLSRWKGGGFGMYTEIHPNSNTVWITGQEIPIDSLKKLSPKLSKSIDALKTLPSPSAMALVAAGIQNLSQSDSLLIQVWKPMFNGNTGEYTRELITQQQFN